MRKVLAIACGLVLLMPALQAGNDIEIARSALRDGLWELARMHVTNRIDAVSRLIVLESYAGDGKWDEVAKTLSKWPELTGDGFDYYRAVVKGDHASAIAILKRGGSEAGIVEAEMYEAGELAKAGDRKAASVIWRDVLGRTNLSERVLASASVNLGDVAELRRAYKEVLSPAVKRKVGLRLGRELLKSGETVEEGALLVRTIVKDSPDADGAPEAFLALVDKRIDMGYWKEASILIGEALETWPELSKRPLLQEHCGWVAFRLGRLDEALEAYELAAALATDDEARARAMLKAGDVLAAQGKSEDAQKRYQRVLADFPVSKAAARARKAVEEWVIESRGREHYRAFRFGAAMEAFRKVGDMELSRKPLMDYFCMLCLYGQGQDDAAFAEAVRLASGSPDLNVKGKATLWAAKFEYNRGNWKDSCRLFSEYAAMASDSSAAEALLWSARAAFADGNLQQAILLSTRIVGKYPDSSEAMHALLLQGELLVELSRYDEAVMVFDRVTALPCIGDGERMRAKLMKADALYAIGADNQARYEAAAEIYGAVYCDGLLSPSERIVVSFKLGKVLEKLKRIEEAFDKYYSQVLLAYRDGRRRGEHFNDSAQAAFSKAAFRLADVCESRGRDRQAIAVLELLAESDVPASEEAAKRIRSISTKGRLL